MRWLEERPRDRAAFARGGGDGQKSALARSSLRMCARSKVTTRRDCVSCAATATFQYTRALERVCVCVACHSA